MSAACFWSRMPPQHGSATSTDGQSGRSGIWRRSPIAVPDGSATVCVEALPRDRPWRQLGLSVAARRSAAWFAQRLPAPKALVMRSGKGFDPAVAFDLGDPDSRPLAPDAGTASPGRLDRCGGVAPAKLPVSLERLGEFVPAPFAHLPEGACPLVFPVATDDKRALLLRLADAGVHAIDYWSVPDPTLPADRFPDAARRRATTVALPVHQGLRESDLIRIAEAAAAFLASNSS
jgi:hypothetical protein